MALLVLHDPYEWFDPERGRQGVLIHSSQIGGREHMVVRERPSEMTWRDVWKVLDGGLPPYVISGEWDDPEPDGGRNHPYGADAYQIEICGRVYIFPNKEAADAHQRTR